jgi:hypothetical protein
LPPLPRVSAKGLEVATAAFGGDAGKAKDALVSSKEGGDLYVCAVKVDAYERSRARWQ